MVDQFYSDPATLRRLRTGVLGAHIDGYARTLAERGYSRITARYSLRVVRHLNDWLHRRRLCATDLDEARICEFFRDYGSRVSIKRNDPPALRDWLKYLRETNVVPYCVPEAKGSAIDRVIADYSQYLIRERGLSKRTVHDYVSMVRTFLLGRFGTRPVHLEKLQALDSNRFILHYARTRSSGRTQKIASLLRSFLRFLYQRGAITKDLSLSIPSIANWRLSGLPKYLEPEQVEQLLESCNRDNPVGRRDYAILLLLARLGLRAGEVVHLALDDIDWQAGELMVRGKSSRCSRLPIPHDVGEALATYLHHDRPRCLSRAVFIRVKAPQQGFATASGISYIVQRALERARIHSSTKGANLLRHSLATQMLRNGGALREIAEVLNHQLPSTTEIYAKVDLLALRKLAQPWKGGRA